MNLKEYQKFCQKMHLPQESKEKEIMTWGLGVAGEANDVAGCIKKTYAHKDDHIEGIKENLGDTLWYVAMICNFYRWTIDEVIKENVDKLKERYPEGASFESAKRKRTDWNE
jgi:NTP pyrophosphatase (non-canonical NTP hydrolase)